MGDRLLGRYFCDNGDYQVPEHVDMTAMTHFVFARIGPGVGKSGLPGEIVLGGEGDNAGFIDPNAVEPGPYPNPLPPAPVPTVSVSFDKPNDWGSGWRGTMTVENVGDVAGWFVSETDFPDTVTALWNGTYTLENNKLVVKGMNWNTMLRPGDQTEIGLCASRPAKPVETPPELPAGALTTKLIITGDRGSGYCAKVAVTNTSAVKAVRWSVQLPIQGTPSGMWNGKYTLENAVMTLSGADWNPDLAPGVTNEDPGFCASR